MLFPRPQKQRSQLDGVSAMLSVLCCFSSGHGLPYFQDREGESSRLFQQQRRSELVEIGLARRLQNANKMRLEMTLEMQLQPDLVQVEEALDVREVGSTVHSPGGGPASSPLGPMGRF